jgi:hypothetical protein
MAPPLLLNVGKVEPLGTWPRGLVARARLLTRGQPCRWIVVCHLRCILEGQRSHVFRPGPSARSLVSPMHVGTGGFSSFQTLPPGVRAGHMACGIRSIRTTHRRCWAGKPERDRLVRSGPRHNAAGCSGTARVAQRRDAWYCGDDTTHRTDAMCQRLLENLLAVWDVVQNSG